jgi:hypothetical protein
MTRAVNYFVYCPIYEFHVHMTLKTSNCGQKMLVHLERVVVETFFESVSPATTKGGKNYAAKNHLLSGAVDPRA